VSKLIRGELVKLRTTRTALGFAAGAALLTVALVLLGILAGNPETIDEKRDALAIGSTVAVLVLLFGVVGSSSEYRHRTLAPALLVAPGRGRLLLARVFAYGLAGLGIGVAMLAVALAIGLPLLAGQPGPSLDTGDYLSTVGGGLLATLLCTMLGVGLGTMVSRQVPAVIGAMVWFFILEPLTGLVGDISKFTVGQSSSVIGGNGGDGDLLPWGVSLLVLLAWTVAFVAVGALVDRRRDIA
jgi:ABC-2 type transport system permease protein